MFGLGRKRKADSITPQERARKVRRTLSDVTGDNMLTAKDREMLKALAAGKSIAEARECYDKEDVDES